MADSVYKVIYAHLGPGRRFSLLLRQSNLQPT
jgi:hypothetical protein